jgi:HK97 family phage major capsid protein
MAAKVNNVYEKAIQGMGVQVGEDGGFLVMPEFASGILERVYWNNLFSQTDNYTVSGNSITFNRNAESSRVNGSRHGGLRGYWGPEGGSLTSSNPKIRQSNT